MCRLRLTPDETRRLLMRTLAVLCGAIAGRVALVSVRLSKSASDTQASERTNEQTICNCLRGL